MDVTTAAILALTLLFGALMGLLLGIAWARQRALHHPEHDRSAARAEQALAALERRVADDAVVQERLGQLHVAMRDLEQGRATWQGEFAEQVASMRHTTESLRRETHSLSNSLRRPTVRGRWGELHLRRVVELAGMVDRCDFSEQVRLADGALRPDLVVHLAGERSIVVDAKVPLDAYLDAAQADDDPDEQAAHLARHVRQFRSHIDTLSARKYWQSLSETPEFVVLFVPAEAFLSAALEHDPTLLEYAADRKVIPATPTTLVALLRTVAHGWTHQSLAQRAREVHELGRELHDRLSNAVGHLDTVGKSLDAAVTSYNRAIGSIETRVLVSARKLHELDVTDETLASPRRVETAARRSA